MTSILKADDIQDSSGNNIINEAGDTITIGASGDTITIPSGATISNLGTASGFSGGLAEVSQYRMGGTTISVSATTATLLDNAFAEVYKVGTGMTYSSGIWTFPSTGIWRIELCLTLLAQSSGGDCRYAGGQIHTTPDDGTYTNVANVYTNANWISSNWYMGTHSDVFFDVTSTSTHKVKFFAYSAVDTATEQSTSANRTYATFTRLGDT